MTARPTRGTVEPRLILSVLVIVLITVVVISVVVPDSPYVSDVAIERSPFAPERPTELNRTTATAHAVAYEERVLRNDILGSRGFSLDRNDEIRARCVTAGVQRRADGRENRFRIRLQCRGDILDVNRPLQPSGFEYATTYVVIPNETRRIDTDGYPYRDDGNLATAIPDDGDSPPPTLLCK